MVLLQKEQPIAYASRTLTATERNYAQIEKEMLSVVFACEKFNHYLHGKETIRALTDHKPLEVIFSKPLLSAPKRLQRMRLKLLKYPLKVHNQQGKKMHISDALSRAPRKTRDSQDDTNWRVFYAELEDVNYATNINVSDSRMEQVRGESRQDPNMQVLMNLILSGWPEEKTLTPLWTREYWNYRDELITQNGLVFKGIDL